MRGVRVEIRTNPLANASEKNPIGRGKIIVLSFNSSRPGLIVNFK